MPIRRVQIYQLDCYSYNKIAEVDFDIKSNNKINQGETGVSYGQAALLSLALGIIEIAIIVIITKRNEDIFEPDLGRSFIFSVKVLGKTRPFEAFVLLACYAAILIEVFWLDSLGPRWR